MTVDNRTAADDRASAHVRLLKPDEFRTAHTLFRACLHHGPVSEELWPTLESSFTEGRVFGAFADDTLIGTTLSLASELAVPGGGMLPMAMITRVGVRADHTRRGALTALMRAQLTGLAEPVATLRASEGGIYARFGYGVATRGRNVVVDRRRAVLRPTAPTGGRVRIEPYVQAHPLAAALYERIEERRPGWAARPDSWNQSTLLYTKESKRNTLIAVHSGPDGDDGYAVYAVQPDDDERPAVMDVHELAADNPVAWAGLWRFLLSVDLVGEIRMELRPLDEPLEPMLVDPRAVRTTKVEDETWLRLVDVPAALAARSFNELAPGVGSVVVEVRDHVLPANSGRYRIGAGPARPVDETAELAVDVETLAALYLGDVAPSVLAAVGRVEVAKSDALRVADRLFAVSGSPWCGTYF